MGNAPRSDASNTMSMTQPVIARVSVLFRHCEPAVTTRNEASKEARFLETVVT